MGLQSNDVSIDDQILASQYNNLRTDALLGWAQLTNKSGGSVSDGDVVVVDTSSDSAFTTTTSAGDSSVLGVVAENVDNNASGRLYPPGAVVTVNVTGAVTRGHYLDTSSTAKKARDAGNTLGRGVFAVALTAAAGPGDGTVTAMLLIGKTARGGFPSGLIVLYDSDCPSGWTRFSALDGKYPKGAAAYGGTGGAATHTHTYSDLPQHTHTNSAGCGSAGGHSHDGSGFGVGTTGSHQHHAGSSVLVDSGGTNCRTTSTGTVNTSSDGGHTHDIGGNTGTEPNHSHSLTLTIDNAGVASPESDSASSEPPYLEMVFCEKD